MICPCIYTSEQTGGFSHKFFVSLIPLQAFQPLYSLVFCHKKYKHSICANLVTLASCNIQYSRVMFCAKYSYAHLCVCVWGGGGRF